MEALGGLLWPLPCIVILVLAILFFWGCPINVVHFEKSKQKVRRATNVFEGGKKSQQIRNRVIEFEFKHMNCKSPLEFLILEQDL